MLHGIIERHLQRDQCSAVLPSARIGSAVAFYDTRSEHTSDHGRASSVEHAASDVLCIS
jgi:hypothetical protein